MFPRAPRRSSLRLLAVAMALSCAVAGCKRAEREQPKPALPAPVVVAAPAATKQEAMDKLLALPELQAWSKQIETRSRGKSHGAVIEDNPIPREVNGKKYYQLSFVENRAQDVQRRESFLVAQDGGEILVQDTDADTLLSLQEWRRTIERVDLKSAN